MCHSILQRTFAASLALLLVILPGQARAESSAEQPSKTPGLPPDVSAEGTCAGKPEGSACWLELDNQPGCYFWNPFTVFVNMQATWSGVCTGGLAEGSGEITFVWGIDQEHKINLTGWHRQGKQHGRWVERYDDGTVAEGPYYNGISHGPWVWCSMNDTVREGLVIDGKRHS